jgi:hypothetical protein
MGTSGGECTPRSGTWNAGLVHADERDHASHLWGMASPAAATMGCIILRQMTFT